MLVNATYEVGHKSIGSQCLKFGARPCNASQFIDRLRAWSWEEDYSAEQEAVVNNGLKNVLLQATYPISCHIVRMANGSTRGK